MCCVFLCFQDVTPQTAAKRGSRLICVCNNGNKENNNTVYLPKPSRGDFFRQSTIMPAGTKENYVDLQLDRDRVKHLAWVYGQIPTSSDHAEAIANATMTTTRVQPTAPAAAAVAAAFAIPPLLPNTQQPPPSVAMSLLGAPAIYHQAQHQLSTLGQPESGSEWPRYIPQQVSSSNGGRSSGAGGGGSSFWLALTLVA